MIDPLLLSQSSFLSIIATITAIQSSASMTQEQGIITALILSVLAYIAHVVSQKLLELSETKSHFFIPFKSCSDVLQILYMFFLFLAVGLLGSIFVGTITEYKVTFYSSTVVLIIVFILAITKNTLIVLTRASTAR